MSSKLHRRGLPTDQAVVWQPASKDGGRPVSSARETSPHAAQPLGRDSDDQGRELERQAEMRAQAAHQRGLQEGEANARQQATAQVQGAIDRLGKTVNELAGVRAGLRHEAEQDVVKLAMAIARRILYRELSTDPEALLGLVRAALDKLDGREIHRLRTHPQDAAVLQKQLQTMGMPRKIEVVADPNLTLGAAIFETTHGTFDASAETQLKEIERGFTDLMKHSS